MAIKSVPQGLLIQRSVEFPPQHHAARGHEGKTRVELAGPCELYLLR